MEENEVRRLVTTDQLPPHCFTNHKSHKSNITDPSYTSTPHLTCLESDAK